MKIAVIGFGDMGKAVYEVALDRKHTVDITVDKHSNSGLTNLSVESLSDIDVAIDFSNGASALQHLDICIGANVNLIMGSTGWYDHLPEVKKMVKESDVGVLWSANFSIGVNVYYKVVEMAAKLMNSFEEYDVWGHEMHHSNKADSPSGTAKILGDILLKNVDRKDKIVEEKLDRKRADNEIQFSSVRGGPVNFSHTIGFDSAADTITVNHAARNRDGYALGSVKAAEWLKGKQGLFGMDDFLNLDNK